MTAIHTLSILSDGKIKELGDAQFARIKHFSQSSVYGGLNYMAGRLGNFKDGANDPSVIKYPFENESYWFVTLEQEKWWRGLFDEVAEGTMTKAELDIAWKNLIMPKKAFTNNRDLSVYGYLFSDKPLRCEPVWASGATIKKIGEPYPQNDGWMWQNFEVIDVMTDEWKTMTMKTHWWLIQSATTSRSVGTTGKVEVINPFPKMAGDRRVPYLLWAKGTKVARIRTDWLEDLGYVEKPAYPYMPRRNTADNDFWDTSV